MASITPVSVRFDRELNERLSSVIKEQHISKADFIRLAVIEKLEDMYDIEIADKSYQDWLDNGKKTFSHKELMKRYG